MPWEASKTISRDRMRIGCMFFMIAVVQELNN
jgi:hypothetical protein